ncbi:MAG TPA: ABC transporter ATP-binding protein [Geminicoccaceae bacterium]|nr:ABC transporter ATP-binding protein [Geminicoccaceae bacterium]
MDTLLAIEGLAKRFGPITAVDGVSFTVARGEVLGFLGPNGAGKSTTMRMITGYLPPDAGRVEVCGIDLARDPIEVRRRIGYLPEGAPAYGDMTPAALLDFVATLRRYPAAEKRQRLQGVIERLALQSVLLQPIETLSKGFKRRVGLAVALLHDPEVLILDEPTDGLDPNQKHQVRTLLADMAKDKAIIISTHILEEVDALCTRAIVIARGRIVADAKPAELEARSSYHNAVTLRLPDDQVEPARAVVGALEGVAKIEASDLGGGLGQLLVLPRGHADILDPVCRAIDAAGLGVNEVFVERGRLDEVFRQLTQAA